MPSVAYLKDAPQTMTKKELAKFMRLDRKTIERNTIRPGNKRGWIPCDRAGNRCRYDKTRVEQAILGRAI